MTVVLILFLIGNIIFFIWCCNYANKLNDLKVDKEELIKDAEARLLELQTDRKKVIDTAIEKLDNIESQTKKLEQEEKDLLVKIATQQTNFKNLCEQEKDKLLLEAEKYKQTLKFSSEQYLGTIEAAYVKTEKEYGEKIAILKNSYVETSYALQEEIISITAELDAIKKSLTAATEALLREKEKNNNLSFYKLSLSKDEENDIALLESIKSRLKDPRALCMLIWSTYFQKQTNDLCNRVLKMKTPTGIYKITNLITKEVYIGQATDISSRFKQHIKCGLGIDTPTTNKLYKSMLEYGICNFTFELMEECSKDELNEKERFYIDMYQSNKIGLNVSRGIKE